MFCKWVLNWSGKLAGGGGTGARSGGLPKAHEVFDGNVQDRATVDEMLDALEKRTGRKAGATVDRGMAYEENLQQIRRRGYHYIVSGRQSERKEWLEELEKEDDWGEIIRMPSPRNPLQKKTRVEIKRRQKGDEVYILCRSEGREEKDRLKKTDKIHQAIGRLKEPYPRVARYFEIEYEIEKSHLVWQENAEKRAIAKKLDGSYVLKTDRQDLSADEIWRTYILLTRVERAFRDMKSSLMERPIFHHLKHRVRTHIFLCLLAYHLLVTIEKYFLDQGIHTSWWTIRRQLSTHHVVTVCCRQRTGPFSASEREPRRIASRRISTRF